MHDLSFVLSSFFFLFFFFFGHENHATVCTVNSSRTIESDCGSGPLGQFRVVVVFITRGQRSDPCQHNHFSLKANDAAATQSACCISVV